MDLRASISLLVLLLGLSKALPVMVRMPEIFRTLSLNSNCLFVPFYLNILVFICSQEDSDENEIFLEESDSVDLTTQILSTNNGLFLII